jgi:alpha-beta hydrolase superfamily lysophospholipase
VGAVVAGGLVLLDRMANRVVKPSPAEADVTVPDLGIAHQDIRIPSGDHTLHGWLLHPDGRPRRPLVLLAHGWGANYGALLRLAEPLVEAGYQVLLFDVRGHGRNQEVAYATVRNFRDDVSAVARYAEERFAGRPAVLLGHSLGGAAGVLAVAEGATLAGLGLLASPADVMEVTALYMKDKGLPGHLMVRVLRPFWWLRVGGTFRPLTPGRRIEEVKVPVLVVHPENDHRVPRAHAQRLADGAQTTVRLVEDAGHTDFLGREETWRHVLNFLEEVEAGLTDGASPGDGDSIGTRQS